MNLSNESRFRFGNKLEICRLCLAFTKSCFSLIDDREASGMLEALTSLRILPSDDISTIMCLKCSLNLKLAFTIQQNMLIAEQRFREHTFFSAPIKQECDIWNVESDENYSKIEVHETKGIEDDQKQSSINEHSCKVCDKKCSSKAALGKHMLGVHVEAECPLCGKKMRKKCLKRHMKDVHHAQIKQCNIQNVEPNEKCLKAEVHETKEINDDQKKHNTNEYSCKVCSKKCSSKIALDKHMLGVHVDAECPLCGKKYRKKCLKRHMKDVHHTQIEEVTKKYICDICGEAKTSKYKLDEHKRVHVLLKCAICNEKFAKSQLKEHAKEHDVSIAEVTKFAKNILGDYTCDICGKVYSLMRLLNRHKYNVHLREKCPICGKEFSKGNLKVHVFRHGVSTTQTEKESNPDDAQNEPNADSAGKYVCDICGKKKFSQVDLSKHKYNVHVMALCPICKKTISQTNIKRHIERHKGSRTICELCGISVLQQDLRVHMYNTHTVRKLKCNFCEKIFSKNHLRTMHEKIHHLGQADFTCDTCGKSFFKKHCLKTHIERTHLKLRPHICEFCNIGFSSKVTLMTHRRQHTNERPYKCEFCGEGFRQNVSLKSHLKSQHGVIEELNCECKKCGKKFASRAALFSHSRIH